MESRIASVSNNRQPNEEDSSGVKELINTFSKRRVKLREWIEKASTFYMEGKYDDFEELLENAITRGSKSYVDYKNDLLRTHMILAAHFVRLAYSDPGNRRAAWQEKVATLLTAVDNMQVAAGEMLHLLCRGFALMLINLRLPEADNCFVAVLRQTPNDVHALLGRGCLAYNRQEYRVALGYFKHILLHYPQGPLDVRVGIAHCFLKLDDLDSARRAFELALVNNGRCLNALLGMAQLKLNERTLPANQEAINLLCAAYELNQRHPLVLSWLAGHLYYQRDYETLRVMAGNAYVATDSEQLKAQNCFQIARGFHAQLNYAQAFAFYGRAVGHCPAEFAPPHLGLAQMYVRRGQLDKAENSLRALLKMLPQQPQALRMLATLFAQTDAEGKWDMAIHLFKKAASEDDFDSWLGLAATYERKQLWSEALESYDHAVRIYQRLHNTVHDVPLIWLNNMAALQMHAGRPKAALQTLDKALSMTPDATQEHYESNLLTLRFNRARVLEELHLVEQAENSYQQLILEYPNYYDCYLRLGVMAQKRNQLNVAKEKYQAVLQLDRENEAANIYLGNYHFRQGNLELAMYHYNVIIQRNSEVEDSYMLVALGNVGLINLQRAIDEGDQGMTKHQVQNALQIYRKVLEQNQRNLWAANGIGVALSCSGYLSDAETIFKQITESPKRCPEAVLNSAHVALELEHYVEAIELYNQYLKELPATNCFLVMQLLAKSLFQVGRIKEAKEWLQKARHVAPHNRNLLYNLAIVIKQEGSDSFGMSGTNLVELQRAEGVLKLAQGFFSFLGQQEESLSSSKNQADLCRQILENPPAELKSFRIQQNQNIMKKLEKSEQNNLTSQEISKKITDELFIKPTSEDREASNKPKKSHREHSVRSRRSDREPSARHKELDRESSARHKKSDREPSARYKKSDKEPSTKPKDLDKETFTERKKLDREPSTRPKKLDEEATTKPKKLDEEAAAKPKQLDEESSTKPKMPDEEAAAKLKKSDREPSAKPKMSDTEQKKFEERSTKHNKSVKGSSTQSQKLNEEAATKPKKSDEEAATKPKKSDEEAVTKPKKSDEEADTKPKKSDEEAVTKPKRSEKESSAKSKKSDTESSTKPKKLDEELSGKQYKSDREPSTRPKRSHRESSAKPKELDEELYTKTKKSDEGSSAKAKKLDDESSSKPKKVDGEAVTKPANVDKEASTVSTKKEEKETTQIIEKAIKATEKSDTKLYLKKDENNATVVKEESKNVSTETPDKPIESRSKSKKRKHRSREKKNRDTGSEPKDKKCKEKK